MNRLLNNDLRLIIGMLIATGGVFSLDLQFPLGVAGGVPYVAPVLIAWWIKNRRWIIISAALGSVLTIAGFFLSPEGGTSWVVLTNRGLALFAIWTAAILSYQRRSALRDLQLSEIQTREETALTQIGRVITSSLDINHVYQRFTEQVNTLIPFDRATIILVDHERDVLITAHQEGIDVPQRRAGTATPLAGSLTSAIVRTASSVSVHATDRDELARQYSGLLPAFDAGLVSFLAAPLISRDRVIGLIQLGSTNPSAFGQREIALVERVADQIAGSVANSELFVHAEQVSQERDILAEIGRIMTSSLNISEVYDRFAHAVSRLLPYDRMSMTTIDHEEGKRVILHASGTPVSNWISGMNQPLEGTFTDTVIQSGAPATFDEQQLHARNPDLLTAGLRSTLSLPIISHGESIGAFHLHRKDPDGFSRREVQLVEQISAQIAGAIANERLRHDLERDARERAVLVEISRVIGSSLDIHHVYEQFAEIVGTLISSDRVHINLLSDDLETSTMEFVYGVSVPERSEGQRIQVAGTFNEALIREQKAIVHLPITEEDTRKRYPGLMPSVNAGLQSFLGAPLISNGRMIGTIQWLSYQSGQYSLRDADLGERVAAQIAGALDNANIYAENQQYQTALRQSEQRFSGILDIAEEAVVSVDESFRVTMFNQGAARIFGYEADEVIGESLDVLIPEELISVHQKRISEFATSTDNALHMSERGRQVYGLRKDGAKFPAEASVSRLDMGDTTVFTAILRDITQRKQAEEALRGSEAQYRELYHGAPIAYISSDADGVIVQANQRAAELFGYPLDELVGSPLTRLYAPTPDGIEKAKKVFAERGGSSDGPAVELEYQRADGRQLWGSLSVQQFLDTDGNVLARRSMVVDITERKLLEIQLAQSQKMEAVGQLAGGIAHDFNNLLTAIVGYADLASMDQRQTDSTDRYVRGIKTAAERAAELTRQLLAFSRRQVIVPVVLDLNALILDLNSMLRRIIGEDVELVTVTSADLSAVEADRGQIEQVIMNLAVNARDAMPSGGKLIIETSTEQLGERNTILNANISPGAYNVLTVTDTGVGMTEEVQDHIFEPFFTTKGVGEGTGLGLSTCYGIVTQSGGHITVDSQPGEGTTFKVFLPRVEEKPTAESRPDEKRSWPTGIETVLLAEDEPLVRSLIVEVLESQGYNVLQASNGAEAMRIAESQTQEPIDLLLTDIVMPLMGGNELANRFRVLRPEAKIIYMSGYPKDLPESGAEFIEKPTSPDILASKVRSVLDSASAPSDSS